MATAIRMPQPGQMTEECTILRWFKTEGDTVARGDPLFEIETDKSNMEIEAFDEGVLLRVLVAEGETVPVDSVVAWIGQPGEAVPDGEGATPSPAATPRGPSPAGQLGAYPSQAGAYPAGESGESAAAEVTVEESAAATEASGSSPEAAGGATEARPGGRRLSISPRASRLAAELGVDPRTVAGTGPGGRIVERDVRAAVHAAVPQRTPASPPAVPGPPALEDGEPLGRIRQVIARRLTESVTTIPQFTVTVAVDMTGLMALRARIKQAGSPITVTDFIHAAAVQALVELPLVNARTDGRTMWRRERVHLGIAVAIPDGLLVPVVRDAQDLSLAGLHARAAAAIAGARAGMLGPDELSGSTFSVSNMGMFGVEEFGAIINPGESAILAVSSVRPEPAVVGDGIAIRQMLRLTLTADHRLVDGELAARFLNAVRRRLEDAGAFADQVARG